MCALVTGVQTCALPILPLLGAFRKAADQRSSDPKPGNRDERDQNRDRDETLFAAGERIHLAIFRVSAATSTGWPVAVWAGVSELESRTLARMGERRRAATTCTHRSEARGGGKECVSTGKSGGGG